MKYARLTCVAMLAALLPACNLDSSRRAFGDPHTIVVLAVDSLWAEVGDSVLRALEPRVFTTRNERTFEVTHMSPLDERWNQLRQFVQVLAIGVPGDGWITPLVESPPQTLPAVVERDNVWAQGQTVTGLVVPQDNPAAAVLAMADSLGGRFDARFRAYATQRMFASGQATALRDSLQTGAGFGITLPNVYRAIEQADSIRLFRSESQVGGTLFRSIAIASRDGVQDVDAQQLVAWRDSLAARYYTRPEQDTQRDTLLVDTLAGGALEVQGVWRSTDASYPEAGVFVSRAVPCPAQNRVYLLDAWLLAPGRSKYEYLIQFQNILDSFECAGAQA